MTDDHSAEFLVRQLRESQGYLADEGWHEVARLMISAADEIERLVERVQQLENPRGQRSAS